LRCYLVGDGLVDLYGVFSSRELAEAWIQRQKRRGYPFELVIEEWNMDQAKDTPIRFRGLSADDGTD
jgi:hypothetical protein